MTRANAKHPVLWGGVYIERFARGPLRVLSMRARYLNMRPVWGLVRLLQEDEIALKLWEES